MKKYQLGFAFTPLLIILAALVAIGAGGYYVGKNRAITPAPQMAVSNELGGDNLADWKTYHNDEYGFEVKYPPTSFELREDTDNNPILRMYPLPQPAEFGPSLFISADVPVESPSVSVRDLKKYIHTTLLEDNYSIFSEEDTVISDQAAVKVLVKQKDPDGPDFSVTTVYLVHDGLIYHLTYYGGSNEQNKIFDQILSTFKFINILVSSPALKIYRNNQAGFQFSYPGNWELNESSYDGTPEHLIVNVFDPKYGNPGNSLKSNSFSVLGSVCRSHDWVESSDDNWNKTVCYLASGKTIKLSAVDDVTKITTDKILSSFKITK
jgi:hypothetical protein